ncbi:MAG: S46 family peptidase [Bacteroidales bacterium]
MKSIALMLSGIFVIFNSLFAFTPPDEGMWLPMFVDRLNYTDMQQMGLNLTAEEIYSINNSSLKDAIVGLASEASPNGYFCTGEIVSDKGLMFTNHHCGYDIIQQHSSLEHDYLNDGFWAKNLNEELVNESLSASFLVKMDNVTDSIFNELSDTLSESDKRSKIREIRKELEKNASADGTFHVAVRSFFAGNEYYRFVYKVYTDVRLVGAPPSSIGKYGGDTDNWMWPRHTGDFSIFRVYAAPDGSPADYSEENVPLKPNHYLPVSLKGVQKDDFAMIWGYPGTTERYMTSYGVQYSLDHFNPAIIDLFGKRLEIMKSEMDADREVGIQYASEYASIANTWKYMIGQSRGVKNLKVVEKKKKIENDFSAWVEKDEARKEKYGNALSDIEASYKSQAEIIGPMIYYSLGLLGPSILLYTQEFGQLEEQLKNEKENPVAPQETAEVLKESIDEHFKNYSAPLDEKLMAGLFEMFANDVPKEMYPDFLIEIQKKYKGEYAKFAADLYAKSIFSSKEKVLAFLEKPSAKKISNDPAYLLTGKIMESMMGSQGTYMQAQSGFGSAEKLFVAGLREMNPEKVYYPDANSTMRLSYGSVQDYYPADAIHYDFTTHLKGLMEKEDPTNDEFIVPDRLKELYEKKDYGRYGSDGKLVVGFLTTNDITGGNSGSPVINGNGELIGLAFDGNWEAMSGDIAFEPELQRTICVDVRYVLFIIDKFAGATNIIDELTIVQ